MKSKLIILLVSIIVGVSSCKKEKNDYPEDVQAEINECAESGGTAAKYIHIVRFDGEFEIRVDENFELGVVKSICVFDSDYANIFIKYHHPTLDYGGATSSFTAEIISAEYYE